MKKAALAAVLSATLVLACTSNQRKGAASGATSGAISGAAAGAVSALIFGGDVGEAAARGAVWAGTAGAVGGTMVGAEVDRQQAQQGQTQAEAEAQRQLEQLRQQIGDDAYNGLGALAECKHEVALAYADAASGDPDPEHALAGTWLETLTYLDSGRTPEAEALYPQLAARDPKARSAATVKALTLDTLEIVRDFRVKEGRPRYCP